MVGEHKPRQFPTCDCGIPAIAHRPSHNPDPWPVCKCGARSENHRVKHEFRPGCCLLSEDKHIAGGPSYYTNHRYQYVGVDGEGIGRNPHLYVMLCAATTEGQRWYLEDAKGLKSRDCLAWLTETLDRCRCFTYGFGYDITMIIRDLPDRLIYDLLRPDRRYDKGKLRPIKWHGFTLNWLQGKFTVTHGRKRAILWDILKFYQQTFVKSLCDWFPERKERIEVIEKMKEKRSAFTVQDMPEMRDYCHSECSELADLARALIAAHKSADLTLKSYYGPGSTASVLLTKMGVLDYTKDVPDRMLEPVARAFFGGWFEHSVIGIVKEVYSDDISSAYPYHAYHLPCLLHGKWIHVRQGINRRLANCTTALIHYRYKGDPADVWAPFPHRSARGQITHPWRTEGWTWLPEYRAARGMGELEPIEAWVYNTDCDCHPFAAISDYYRQRCQLGKDGPGKIYKLGPNSVYGKLVQSKGPKPKFQNWVWGGLITSGTRAQVIRGIQSAPNMSDIIAIATDGIFSKRRLSLDKPSDTGTFDLAKPLGGWERKEYPQGMLFLKPGIYISLAESSEQVVKARGIGRKQLLEKRAQIVKAYLRGHRKFTIWVDRFHGAKSCITPKRRTAQFGQWGKMKIQISFTCPNRNPDMSLFEQDTISVPYKPSLIDDEGLGRFLHDEIEYEQP